MSRGKPTMLGCIVAIGAVLMLSACGSDGGSGSTDNGKVTIGLITPFSGPAASYGPPERDSLEVAIQRVNQDGGVTVGGKKYTFALKTYDSAYDPTKAVTVARQAVNQDGLKFLEVLGGGIVPAVQPITEPAKVLVFAAAAGDAFVGEKYPMTFRPYYDIPQSAAADLKYLQPNLGSSPQVVHMYPDDDLGHSVAPKTEKLAQELGFGSKTIYLRRDATDFAPALNKVVSTADVIDFGPTPPSQYAVIVKQARQLGYKGKFAFPDTLDLATVTKTAGAKAIAGSVTSPAWESWDNEAGAYWKTEVGKKRDDLQGWTAQSFDNLLLLKAAIEKAQSLDPVKVADALPQVSVEGALGKVGYGGEETYGIPRVFDIPYPIAVVTADGKLEPGDSAGA
jgi:branched-chain amino acid transport system substrate-binding protein